MHRILVLALTLCAVQAADPYIWQTSQATRLPGGMLEWAPQAYRYQPGSQVRYIDYEQGDDDADGSSPASAWRHHPWDAAAGGRAAAATGVDTYVFKRGVIYRGALTATESGTVERPIRLCSDPAWGEGEALIQGSDRIDGGWQRVTADTAPAGMPTPTQVWVCKIGKRPQISACWEVGDDATTRIDLARWPNRGTEDPEDVMAGWAEWQDTWPGTGKKQWLPNQQVGTDRSWCAHDGIFADPDPEAYRGMTVWTEYLGLMGSPFPSGVLGHDAKRAAVAIGAVWGGNRRPVAGNRFYVENHPRLLDAAGEYWHDVDGGRLYLRLAGDRDPNRSAIEVAARTSLITLENRSHIEISGLGFRFQRVPQWFNRFWDVAAEDPACVKLLGSADGIRISNNRFADVVRAVWVAGAANGRIDAIAITDNDIAHCDYDAIIVSNGTDKKQGVMGSMDRVSILRNRIHDCGSRPRRAAHGHTVIVDYADRLVVAGNIISRTWGAGIFLHGGKPGGSYPAESLTRNLVFDNQVTESCMASNDWGGIETWQGGPVYIWNNVSTRPHGYWKPLDAVTDENWDAFNQQLNKRFPHKDWSFVTQARSVAGLYDRGMRNNSSAAFAYSYYFDGAFKQYLFNNIAHGRSSDLTSPLLSTGAVHAVGGSFMLAVFNNTFVRFGAGMQRSGRYSSTDLVVGNVMTDIGDMFLRLGHPRQEPNADAPHIPDADPESGKRGVESATLLQAVSANVFDRSARSMGVIELSGRIHESLAGLRQAMIEQKAIAGDLGDQVDGPLLADTSAGDFRPRAGSVAATAGKRVFVPWGLAATVGEWQFRRMENDPCRVVGEHWYMTVEHVDRGMYRHLPRHDLIAVGVTADDYVLAPSEDWTASAMQLDGATQHLVLSDADLRADIQIAGEKKSKGFTFPGAQRQTPDMQTNDFLIECLVQIEAGQSGVIVGKRDDTGWEVAVDEQGHPLIELTVAGSTSRLVGSQVLADGGWHHLLVEVVRGEGVRLHLDGKTDVLTEGMPAAGASLSNHGDLLVGAAHDGSHLAMTIDFLRICKADLDDARTSIDELRSWQEAGPHLHSLWGRRLH